MIARAWQHVALFALTFIPASGLAQAPAETEAPTSMLLVALDETAAVYLLEACRTIGDSSALAGRYSEVLLSEPNARDRLDQGVGDILRALEGNARPAPEMANAGPVLQNVLSRLGSARNVCHGRGSRDTPATDPPAARLTLVFAEWQSLGPHGEGLLLRRTTATLPMDRYQDSSRFQNRFLPLRGVTMPQAVRAVLRHVTADTGGPAEVLDAEVHVHVEEADVCAVPSDGYCMRQPGELELRIAPRSTPSFEASEVEVAPPAEWRIVDADDRDARTWLSIRQGAAAGQWMIHARTAGQYRIRVTLRPRVQLGEHAQRELEVIIHAEPAGLLLHPQHTPPVVVNHPSVTVIPFVFPILSWTQDRPNPFPRGSLVVSAELFGRLVVALRDALAAERLDDVEMSSTWRAAVRDVIDDDVTRELLRTGAWFRRFFGGELGGGNGALSPCNRVAERVGARADALGTTRAGEASVWCRECARLIMDRTRGPFAPVFSAPRTEAPATTMRPIFERSAATQTIDSEHGGRLSMSTSGAPADHVGSYRLSQRLRVCARDEPSACEDVEVATTRNRVGWARATGGVWWSPDDGTVSPAAWLQAELGLPLLFETLEATSGVGLLTTGAHTEGTVTVGGALLPACIIQLLDGSGESGLVCRDLFAARYTAGALYTWPLDGNGTEAWRWYWGLELTLRPLRGEHETGGLDLTLGFRHLPELDGLADGFSVFLGAGGFM